MANSVLPLCFGLCLGLLLPISFAIADLESHHSLLPFVVLVERLRINLLIPRSLSFLLVSVVGFLVGVVSYCGYKAAEWVVNRFQSTRPAVRPRLTIDVGDDDGSDSNMILSPMPGSDAQLEAQGNSDDPRVRRFLRSTSRHEAAAGAGPASPSAAEPDTDLDTEADREREYEDHSDDDEPLSDAFWRHDGSSSDSDSDSNFDDEDEESDEAESESSESNGRNRRRNGELHDSEADGEGEEEEKESGSPVWRKKNKNNRRLPESNSPANEVHQDAGSEQEQKVEEDGSAEKRSKVRDIFEKGWFSFAFGKKSSPEPKDANSESPSS